MMIPHSAARRHGRPRPFPLAVLASLVLTIALTGCAGDHRREEHRPPPMQPLPPRVEPESGDTLSAPTGAAVQLLPFRGHTRWEALTKDKGKGMWILNQRRAGPARRYARDGAAAPGA